MKKSHKDRECLPQSLRKQLSTVARVLADSCGSFLLFCTVLIPLSMATLHCPGLHALLALLFNIFLEDMTRSKNCVPDLADSTWWAVLLFSMNTRLQETRSVALGGSPLLFGFWGL